MKEERTEAYQLALIVFKPTKSKYWLQTIRKVQALDSWCLSMPLKLTLFDI